MVMAPSILLHSPPRGRPQLAFQSVVPELLETELFVPSSLARLSVAAVRSAGFCRPHVSDDNPFSESQFKTRSTDPSSGSASARFRMHAAFASASLLYNTEHYHSGIGLLAPELPHYGRPMESSANAKLS